MLYRNADSEEAPTVRAGRRTRWIAASVEPLRGTVPDAELRRLEAACLVTGMEAMVVTRDIRQLEPDEALAVTRWAARALLRAGLIPRIGPAEPDAPAPSVARPENSEAWPGVRSALLRGAPEVRAERAPAQLVHHPLHLRPLDLPHCRYDLPAQTRRQRGAYMMIPTPARQTSAPAMS